MLESGRILAARYRLLRKLADGRTTQVWLARDAETGADRVLKVLSSESSSDRARFLAAAALQQQVRHRNVQPCEAVHDGDPAFAVFAHVATGDLARLRGRPWREWLPALAAAAEGAAALHAHGIVHRDLKTSNVLLTERGEAVVADFGLAATVGAMDAPTGGSPFSMSPQQLDGAAPAASDDVYALGVLAYELATGYPPFYPDARPERVRTEAPAGIDPRHAMPEPLAQLVLRCLAKRPEDRPREMAGVAVELGAMTQGLGQEPTRAPAASVTLRPPSAADGAIDPQWRRPVAAGPTPDQLRSQGFRRGLVAGGLAFLALVAGFVFFVLPEWVERDAGSAKVETAPVAAAQPGPAATAAPDLRQLAESKQVFDDTRAELARRYAELEVRGAGTWGRDGFASAARKLADGDAAAAQREYPKAIESLRAADADLQAVAELAVSRLKDALAAGAAALDAGDEAESRRQFELALQIEPANASAKRGLERAGTIVEVKRLLAEAEALERSGNSTEAEAVYRKALQLDRDTAAARAGLSRVQSQASSAAFAAAISQGLGSLARKDFAAAKAAFERAGRIRPGAPEVVDGLAQVERAVGDQTIGVHLAAAEQAERAERWSVALTEYRKALDVDRNLLAAQQGVERAEPRAMLDGELSTYLERPERLFSPEVRSVARTAVQRAKGIATPGPVLTNQVAAVERLIAGAETPMRVALASDNQTEVTIYRVGRLGAFERKDMELLPGRYTVVGVRPGYRDVRRELTLLPGSAAPTLVIRCEEPI
jgi:hypothetical protein